MSEIDQLMTVMEAAFEPYWREAWNRRQVEDSLALSSGSIILVDADGEPPADGAPAVGFILARKVLDEVELLLVGVRPEQRRRGLGRKLLERFFEDARSAGATRVFLEVRANNPAESLYRSAGFEPIGRRKGYYRTLDDMAIDALTFAKTL